MEIIGGAIRGTPVVTVICITYNQRKYIRQALESILMQETNFDYEIIIHDDASTDGTVDIVREFVTQNPEKMTAVLQSENRYGKVKISTFTEPLVKGKYVAFCEGDDFWTSELKLQKQYDMMQKHPECSMCVHKVKGVDEEGLNELRLFPRFTINEGICQANEVMHWMLGENEWVFHTTSYFIRSELWRESQVNGPMYVKKSVFGDEAYMRYCAAHGNFFYIDECMSCYRMNSVGSTLNATRGKLYNVSVHERRLAVLEYFDVETEGKFHNDIVIAFEREKAGLLRAKREYKSLLKEKNLYSKLTKSAKVQVFVSAYFPCFDKIYYGIRKLITRY